MCVCGTHRRREVVSPVCIASLAVSAADSAVVAPAALMGGPTIVGRHAVFGGRQQAPHALAQAVPGIMGALQDVAPLGAQGMRSCVGRDHRRTPLCVAAETRRT